MEPASIPDLTSDFDYAAGKLIEELKLLHQVTGQKTGFSELAKSIRERLNDSNVGADLVDLYTSDQVESNKVGHFIETALAFAFRAARLHDSGSNIAWVTLCEAYFMAGMANLQYLLLRGPHLRVQPYESLKKTIIELVASQCPPEKWASFADMWRTIEGSVTEANDKLEGKAGFSKDPKAAFERLAREKREYFLPFLSGTVKRGRPPKTPPRA